MTTTDMKPTSAPIADLLPTVTPRKSITALLHALSTIDSHTHPATIQHTAAQTIINAARALIEEAKHVMGDAWVAMDAETKRHFDIGAEFDPRYPLLEPLPRVPGGGVLQSKSEFGRVGATFGNAWAPVSPLFRGFEGVMRCGGGGRWTGEGGEGWGEMVRMSEEGRRERCKKREVVMEQSGGRMEIVLKEWMDGLMVREQRHVGEEGGEWGHWPEDWEMAGEVHEVLYHRGDKNEGLRGSW